MRLEEARLVPELDVSDLEASFVFYTQVIGFTIAFQRREERFAYLDLDGPNLRLEEAAGPGRRFRTAPVDDLGRGMNHVDALHGRVLAAGSEVVIPMEERRYRVDDLSVGA